MVAVWDAGSMAKEERGFHGPREGMENAKGQSTAKTGLAWVILRWGVQGATDRPRGSVFEPVQYVVLYSSSRARGARGDFTRG